MSETQSPPHPTSALLARGQIKSGSVAPLLSDVSNRYYQLKTSTRAIQADAAKATDKQASYSSVHFGAHSYTFGDSKIDIPSFHFVNYDAADQAILSDVVALINHALANQAPEAAFLRQFFQDSSANGFTSFLSIADRGFGSTPDGAGGEAYRGPGDTTLESAVNVDRRIYSGSTKIAALLIRAFHEFGHANGVHPHYGKFPDLNNVEVLTQIVVTGATAGQANFIDLDTTYKFDQEFIKFVAAYAAKNPEIVVDGNEINLTKYAFSNSELDAYYLGRSDVTGVLQGSAELYENIRISFVKSTVFELFKKIRENEALVRAGKTPPPLIGEPVPETLEILARQGFIKLKDVPETYDEEVSGPWGSRLSHYEQKIKSLVDYDGDNKSKQVKNGAVQDLIIAASNFGFARELINQAILGMTLIDGGQIGLALGSTLAKRVTSDQFGQIIASGALSTVLGALGEFVDEKIFHGVSSAEFLGHGAEAFGTTLLENIKGAGVGALSSYLTAELVNAVGLDGVPAEVANSIGGAVVTQVLNNIPRVGEAIKNAEGVTIGQRDLFTDVGPGLLATAASSYMGSRLATSIHAPESVGGQIGAAVGSAYGSWVASNLFLIYGVNPVTFAAAVVAVVFWQLVGGLIGSIFGGTPRSGADATWDENQGKFTVTNVYARKGGSKDAARQLATAVTGNFNAVLDATGAILIDAEAVQTGNYGMRKRDYVYRPIATRDKDAITARFSGKDGAQQLINHGTYLGLSSMLVQMAGGDIFVKRALAASLSNARGNPDSNAAGAAGIFDMTTLLGDVSFAADYSAYLQNSVAINALIAADPQTPFAAGWLVTLARASELGLNRRSYTDWIGGYGTFMDEVIDGTIGGEKVNAAHLEAGIDPTTGMRYWSVTNASGERLGFSEDTIETGSQTAIEATVANDTIDLRTKKLTDQSGYTVNGKLQDDVAVSGADFIAAYTVVSFAANDLRKQVSVSVAGDVDTATERFLGQLSNATGMSAIGGAATATIVSDSSALATLMVGRSFAAEADGFMVFRLSLSRAVGVDVTVSLLLADKRASGKGADYGASNASSIQVSLDGVTWVSATSATFAAGTTELFVRTAVIADNVVNPDYVGPVEDPITGQITNGNGKPQFLNVEGNETFTLTATVTAGASALANGTSPVSGTGTIIDGASGAPLVWIDNVVVHENTGLATFTISRSRTAGGPASITFSTADQRELEINVAATVDGGDGDDTIHASDLGDNLFGGTGNDTLYGGRLDDWLLGGDGDDVLDAGGAMPGTLGGDGNYLNGGAGNDILRGREGSDWLEGGDGVDTLSGGAGDDILAGGGGDGDALRGGLGDDQYLVRLGDGVDSIEEEAEGAPVASGGTGDYIRQRLEGIRIGTIGKDWAGSSAGVFGKTIAGGDDAIVFGQGIDIGDLQLARSGSNGDDLIIRVMRTENGITGSSGTEITVRGWFASSFKRVEWLKFADGTEVRIGDITSFIIGTGADDVLIGTDGNDFVYGGDGDDQLHLLAGDDIGNGGTGNDLIAGHSGRDLLVGGLGVDQLIGGKGRDVLSGDGGGDDLYGGADDDILSGGRGDGDVVVGGAGNDTFKYSRGDGRDAFMDEFASYWEVVWTSGAWNEAAGFHYNEQTGEVTGPGGIFLRKNVGTAQAPDMQWVGRFDYDDVTKTLRVFNPPAGVSVVANSGTDTIELAPGINIQDIVLSRPSGTNDLVLGISSENAEFASAASLSDSITLKDWYLAPGSIEQLAFYQTGILDIRANATSLIAGSDHDDGSAATPLAGTAIADWITGGAGDDVIAGGAGDDILAGNSGSDVLKGESGFDVLYGGAGNDILDGGLGGDVLIGGNGLDTASYASAPSGVRAHLSAAFVNTGDAAGDKYHSIENLLGGGGADVLGGDAGDNELTGGLGNDTLMGGAGDDTYLWNVSDGADVIHDVSFAVEEAVTAQGELAAGYTRSIWASTGVLQPGYTNRYYWRLQVQGPDGEVVYDYDRFAPASPLLPPPAPATYNQSGWLGGFARTNGYQVTRERVDASVNAGDDVLEFGAGISLSDLSFIISGNDLIIRYGGSAASQVTIRNHFTTNSRIETLQFRDGLAVPLASILAAGSDETVAGTDGDDLLVGRDGAVADRLEGGAGHDVLSGGAGDDWLLGGDGDDVIEGGAGADRIDGGTHSAETVVGWGDTVRYVRSSAGVRIDLRNTTSGQSGGDATGDILISIENVTGSASGDTLIGDDGANRLDGLDGDNILHGLGGDDVLIAGSGADQLYGGAGDDAVAAGAGDDQAWGGTGNDRLDGGEGGDRLYGEEGNDTLTGGEGDDTLLDGGDGDDVIDGGAGNDILAGRAGRDVLVGGAGNDQLDGGAGDDIYQFDAWSGQDLLIDGDGRNAIVFDSSVTSEQLWLTRSGDDLRIGVIGGDATITVRNYFAAAGPTRIASISTTTHSLYLDYAGPLIAAMTAAQTATPASLPGAIKAQLAGYWHAGGKAVPTASPIALVISEDNPTAMIGAGVIDHDENIAGYAIKTPSAHGTVELNPQTGQFVYTPNADFNGEDAFTVLATDADGQAVEVEVRVTVNAVNDAPRDVGIVGGQSLSIAEGAPGSATRPGSVVGQLTATDVEGDALRFTLASDSAGVFEITSDGLLIVTDPSRLDFEAAAAHAIRVRVEDAHGAATEQDFTVSIINVNEMPATPVPTEIRGMIAEGVPANRLVARFALSDPDGDVPTLRLVHNPGGRFEVVGHEVRLAAGTTLDFETLYNSGLAAEDSDGDGLMEVVLTGSVHASDGSLSSGTVSFAIRIEDVNEAPTAVNFSAAVSAVAERDRMASGSGLPAITIGTLSVADPDAAGFAHSSYVYTVSDSRFEIIGSTLRLKQGAVLDYESTSSVTLRVTATDQSANPFSIQRDIVIAVEDRDDVLEGDGNANVLTGQQGRDLIYGFAGNDVLNGGAGNDLLDGGSGDDRLVGGDGADTLLGGDGADHLYGGAGNDVLSGGAHNDVLAGGNGADQLDGGTGDDWADYRWLDNGAAAQGGVTADLLSPSANTGAAAGDTYVSIENVYGTEFADVLKGNDAGNVLNGASGNDELHGRGGNDHLIGGAGNDRILGGDGADTLDGGDGDDILYGGAGNDVLRGGAGNDQLFAESGDDYLDGGTGDDILNGGLDNDTYIVTRSSGADTIYNYDPSGDDVDVIGFQDSDGPINNDDLWFERVGNDMRISVIGTTSSALIKDWYVISDPTSRANYKIDFIIAGTHYSKTINVEGLVTLMAGRTKPATIAARDALMADPSYKVQWASHWGVNAAPVLSAIANQVVNEDGTINLTITATDDITPNANVQLSASVISGTGVIAGSGLVFGAPNSNGQRSFTIRPVAHASGTARIRVQATDAGGITSTREFDVTVNPVADTPLITQFVGGNGNAGQTGGIPLTLNVTFPDTDGSELQEIWIAGVPSGVSLSAGTYDNASGMWKLSAAQTQGLRVNAPIGWSKDLQLSVTARATEGGQTAVSSAATTTVVINAPPTGMRLRGLNMAGTPSITEYTAGTNPNGARVGVVVPVDPDSADNNLIPKYYPTLGSLPQLSLDEYRIRTVTGPTGSMVDVIETGNGFNTGDHGGGVPGAGVGTADTAKAYKFTIYFKPENQLDHYLYFGTSGNVQNIATGATDTNPYFWYGRSSGFVQDRWYRIEGYILPYGSELLDHASFGGVFDTVTGEKVANTSTFRFGSQNTQTGLRFFSYYGANTGYSAQWYEPTVEKVDYSYALTNSAGGRFTINPITGLITAVGTNFNYETATGHNITVRVTDAFGQYKDQTFTIGVQDVNEPNSIPASYSFSVREDAALGQVVGTVAAGDADSSSTAYGQQRYYFWNGSAPSSKSPDGRYSIDAATGKITTAAPLNFEAGNTSTVYRVIARDNQGNAGFNQVETAVTIGIQDVNEANNIPASYSFSVREDAALGQVVGTVAAGDADSSNTVYGQQRYYFWNGSAPSSKSPDGRYSVDAVTGKITTAAPLNFEAGNTAVTYTVIARDNQGNTGFNQVATSVTIGVQNVNEPNSIPASYSFGVGEDAALGQVVGTVAAGDADSSSTAYGQQRYYFWNGSAPSSKSSDGRYSIDAVTGKITTAAPLNFEAGNTRAVYRVIARDNQGNAGFNQVETAVTIGIQNVNEPHTLTAKTFALAENSFAGPLLPVGIDLKTMLSDPEGAAMTWSFADGSTQWGNFRIDPLTGQISLVNGAFDYESLVEIYETYYYVDPYTYQYIEYRVYAGRDTSRATFNLNVKATDGTFQSSATATVVVTDQPEGPVISTAAGNEGDTDSGRMIYQSPTTWWVTANRNVGELVIVTPFDPERTSSSYTYSISTPVIREVNVTYGGSSEADGTGPVLSLKAYSGATGTITFENPGDGEWEGAVKINGVRRTLTMYYNFNLTVTDQSGTSSVHPFEIVFLRRGSSVPPIVFDLDGDGLELVTFDSSTVYFDMDTDGIADRTGWVAADDGVLALDRNGNGAIDNIDEISFADDTAGAISDLEGLRAFDSNGNGFFDVGDERFAEFRIWRDVNQDGVSQADELRTLADHGIVQINLTFNPTGEAPGGSDNVIYATTEYLRTDGSTGTVGDVFLAFDPTDVDGIAAPIILDFDDDGEGLVSLAMSNVRFDMDGDGAAERTGWIEKGDAFLALDRNNDGKISDIAEISFVGDLPGARTDLEGLAAFDSNGDGILSALDDRFAEFKVWLDNNSNGVSDAGEIRSLAEAGVASVSLTAVAPANGNDGGNIIYGKGSFTRTDGKAGSLFDAGLAYSRGDGSSGTATSHWAGAATPSTSSEKAKLPAINVERQDFERKAKKYMLSAINGSVFIRSRDGNTIADERAGFVSPATVLAFKNDTFGMLSPIILDLDGDGVELKLIKKAKARFDMNGDGVADDTGWVGKDDGLLVIDRNGDGLIATASELSFLSEQANARSGLDALSSLDSNKDGRIDASDARFGELKVWVDRNGNGLTDEGELKALADHRIASISLASRAVSFNMKIGANVPVATSTFTRTDGSVGTVGDVALAYRPGTVATGSASTLDQLREWQRGNTAAQISSEIADARLALMAQDMAAFGARVGESEYPDRAHVLNPRFDYFIA